MFGFSWLQEFFYRVQRWRAGTSALLVPGPGAGQHSYSRNNTGHEETRAEKQGDLPTLLVSDRCISVWEVSWDSFIHVLSYP